ncbi:MAG: lipopolysaccharide heptosyltransferase I [Parachlamydiaceae bacterium]|nr:lipopolysaccharide heptosyltransferase I [Parachlamydiaceae bacterium]
MRILIVKSSALGDIVQAFPVLDFIKMKFPNAAIDWVVEKPFSKLVEAHPFIDRVMCIDTKAWRKGLFSSKTRREVADFFRALRKAPYDVIFDLQGNSKSGLITALAKSSVKVGYSKECVSEWPNLLSTNQKVSIPKGKSIRHNYLHVVQSYFKDNQKFSNAPMILKLSEEEEQQFKTILVPLELKEKPLVMVCHGSNWKNKQLPMESLLEFLKLLQSGLNCFFVFGWGTDAEKVEALLLQSHFRDSSLLEKVSLPLLQRLMSKVKLVVAMDSLPLHLAATTSTATFSIFGASSAFRYAPEGAQHVAVQGLCPYGRIFEKRCPILRSCSTGACMSAFSGKELFKRYIAGHTQMHRERNL